MKQIKEKIMIYGMLIYYIKYNNNTFNNKEFYIIIIF